MAWEIEWSEYKARSNIKKHKISFEEAKSVFLDPFSLTVEDEIHSWKQDRFAILGRSDRGRILFVIFRHSEEALRLISARHPTRFEKKAYINGDIQAFFYSQNIR